MKYGIHERHVMLRYNHRKIRYKEIRITWDAQLDRNETVKVYVLLMVEFKGFE